MKAIQTIVFCFVFNICLGMILFCISIQSSLQSAALTPEELFAQKCVARTNTLVVVSGVTYTIQKAYVWGTSCYVLSLEGIATQAIATNFCLAIDPDMHLVFPQTPAEFVAIESVANHVKYC
jgi:hypothetical protein